MAYLLQRAADEPSAYTTPKVTPQSFLATVWALTSLSFLFIPARLYARWKTLHRFYWDDFFVVFAWIASLAITVAVTVSNDLTYNFMYMGAGIMRFPPNYKSITMQFIRLFVTIPMVFYTGLWSIKVAFLLFFRRLGIRNIRSLHYWWWFVTATTSCFYFLCFATLPYRCTLVSFDVSVSKECSTQGFSFISMKVNCALDVLTDISILSIPFLILRRIRISMRQRVALYAIFSLVVITIIFAITRAVITTAGVKQQMDPVWMYMWSSIELNVAIIVACVAPYRSLFIRDRKQSVQARARRFGIQEKGFKLFTSSARPRKDEEAVQSSHIMLPYLAPWPDEECSTSDQQPSAESKTPQTSQRCEQPWMTADLPYLEPWHENRKHEYWRNGQQVRDLAPLPKAYHRDWRSAP